MTKQSQEEEMNKSKEIEEREIILKCENAKRELVALYVNDVKFVPKKELITEIKKKLPKKHNRRNRKYRTLMTEEEYGRDEVIQEVNQILDSIDIH